MIDFKEIPLANTGSGEQDYFELFARDFFLQLGFKIVENPARGTDNGRDLIISELFEHKIDNSITEERWLISCKHYSMSGKSVTAKDEPDIYDRMKSNNCTGFIGFYSTIANESLVRKLNNARFIIYDNKKIESFLTSKPDLLILFKTYFPKSYDRFKKLNEPFIPKKLFESAFESDSEISEIVSGTIFFNKTFPSDKVYKAFLLSDNMISFFEFFELQLRTISYIEDRMKVAEALFYAYLNETIDENEKTEGKIDNQSITFENSLNSNTAKLILSIENYETIKNIEGEKESSSSIAERLKEVVLDHDFPKEIVIKQFGTKGQKIIYFISQDKILYADKLTFDYFNAVFNIVKTNYFV